MYGIVVVEKHQHSTDEGRVFDESAYPVEQFFAKETGIISTCLLARAEVEKEPIKEIDDATSLTS